MASVVNEKTVASAKSEVKKKSLYTRLYEACFRVNFLLEENLTKEQRIEFFKKEGEISEELIKKCNEFIALMEKHFPELEEA